MFCNMHSLILETKIKAAGQAIRFTLICSKAFLLILIIIVSWCQEILQYRETNWLYEEGLETHSYNVTFEEVKSRCTIEEQQKHLERLSLVKFLK